MNSKAKQEIEDDLIKKFLKVGYSLEDSKAHAQAMIVVAETELDDEAQEASRRG